ncbi:MAG TPA: carbon starvation CstA family protein, partial [Bacteroidales bacterium]|nr:carbon starvation CstA family protein [Bacteroidales bacterium]
MITLAGSVALLVFGYFIYGRISERMFGMDPSRVTPAFSKSDGVDFVPMKAWRVFMIQFLNIAGLGPIFGAVLGAMYGPVAYIWIVLGCIFMGATHDYFSGMLSLRHGGASLPELVGIYLGKNMRMFLRIFTLFLLLFVGVAFVSGPAKLLYTMTGFSLPFWLGLIFLYYILATLLPIDKIIGKLYPFFGAA